jgi:holliday junction DNA helicase RuvA
MIGRLRGILMDKRPPLLVVDVHGVGYDVEAPMSTFYRLPEVGSEISLYTHLSIRDDAHLLYGFHTENERRFFRALLKVNGVGAKLALGILSGIELEDFVRCINEGDSTRLSRLRGVGPRTAERLVVEMRDRFQEWDDVQKPTIPGSSDLSPAFSSAVEDAVIALISLGYKSQEASSLVRSVGEDGLTSEALIRKSLQASLNKR